MIEIPTIIEAIYDENLFLPFLGENLTSWRNWFVPLRGIYGLPIARKRRDLIEEATKRDLAQFPSAGFDSALLLTGRRSGKSRIAAIIGAYESTIAGHESKLSPGEKGIVAIVSPTRYQSRIVKEYLRAIFEGSPILQNSIARETAEGFDLTNGNRIEILAGDWRTIRGYTLLACIVDEAAFFGVDEESKVKSDSELIRAIKPALATVRGKLIAISSPYARRGWCYETWKKNFGNDKGKVLVWKCSSRLMNPTLSQEIVDEAMAEDLQAAKSEYLGEFRDDVATFLPLQVIEKVVVKHRQQLAYHSRKTYRAFADVSGGRSDDASLAIAHKENGKTVIDFLRGWKAPFNPHEVILQMTRELAKYHITQVIGDNYAAEFVSTSFSQYGITYLRSEKNKNELYAELLPRMTSEQVELLDNEALIKQLAALERRTRSGGRDLIDHPSGGHDDLANAIAGVVDATAQPTYSLVF